ncbi:Nodule Cysteine-Rich (NCR) secreted peptide [Medicago truncatula]|uniref:Nodule Cysteine-Rich (NCR) secreted peptide n=1 Tax=Medicago truncatula TaxID=3880 RepID=A0A072U0T0_MEDTR|nr:Nodule Cysteine-Rich (NCR) secreted peptide [Medicago truncatula]
MGACPGGNRQCNQHCKETGYTKGGHCRDEGVVCCCSS